MKLWPWVVALIVTVYVGYVVLEHLRPREPKNEAEWAALYSAAGEAR